MKYLNYLRLFYKVVNNWLSKLIRPVILNNSLNSEYRVLPSILLVIILVGVVRAIKLRKLFY